MIKCYRLCKSYGIPIAEIKTFPSITSKLYVEIIDRFEKFKNDNPKADEESGRELTDEDLLEGPQLEEQAQTQEEYRRVASYF